MTLVKFDRLRDIDVTDTVAVREEKEFLVLHIVGNPLQAPPGHAFITGVDQRNLPRLGTTLVNDHLVATHIERHIGHVQEVIGKILLDYIALVTAAYDKVVDAMCCIDLQDMPQNGTTTDFDHRFRSQTGLLSKAGAETSGQNDCLH